MQKPERLAVILFNLGGPDTLAAVRPFLFNLFDDPAILRLPSPFRSLLAWYIARRRAPIAREIYGRIGGRSPILENTERQAAALAASLADLGTVEVFPVMRYWHPRAETVARQVAAFGPDRLVLLPLYPQFSTTTTASSLKEWRGHAGRYGLGEVPTHTVCCYPESAGFVRELARRIAPHLEAAGTAGRPRLLLSAHGLPKKIVAAGDPYQQQVEATATAVRAALKPAEPEVIVCYQSRVGPLEWIGPATLDEVRRAGAEGRPLVVVPVAFVSEHSETLVELDIELAEEAAAAGVPANRRVPTVDAGSLFIEGLADLVCSAAGGPDGIAGEWGQRWCPETSSGCPCPLKPKDRSDSKETAACRTS